jgi:GlpG protein
MRHLSDIESKSNAEAFVAYLLTRGISTHVEAEGSATSNASSANEGAKRWSIWIRDEDRMADARQELTQFLADPQNPRYHQAITDAKEIIRQKSAERRERERSIQKINRGTQPIMGGPMPPLTLTLIILCVVIGLVTNLSRPAENNWLGRTAMKELMFVDSGLYSKTKDPAASLKQLELWRIFTPAFLHGGAMHLLLNMLSLASLGRLTERLEGMGKYAIILLVTAAGAHLLQGLLPETAWGSPYFVGISGVVLGLFGYLAVKSHLRPESGFYFPPDAYLMTALILVLGFISPGGLGLANMAHLGGLATGAVLGAVWNK